MRGELESGLRRTEFNFAGPSSVHVVRRRPAKLNSVRLSPCKPRKKTDIVEFQLEAPFEPAGDQPQAIAALIDGPAAAARSTRS